MRVWVDLTNTAHVLVLRPLVELLEARGHEVELTARPLSHTLRAARRLGPSATPPSAATAARGRLGKARAAAGAGRRSSCASRAAAALRLRARARLHRPAARRAAAADPEHDDVRLRVGGAPAPRQLPPREPRARAGRDPGRAACALRRAAAQARPATPGSRRSTTSRTSSRTRPCSSSSASTATRPLVRRSDGALVRALPRRLRERAAAAAARAPGRGRAAQTVVLARTPEQRDAVSALGDRPA